MVLDGFLGCVCDGGGVWGMCVWWWRVFRGCVCVMVEVFGDVCDGGSV